MKHLTFHSRSWQTQVKNDLMNLTYCLPWVQSRAKYEIPVPWPVSIVLLASLVLTHPLRIEIFSLQLQKCANQESLYIQEALGEAFNVVHCFTAKTQFKYHSLRAHNGKGVFVCPTDLNILFSSLLNPSLNIHTTWVFAQSLSYTTHHRTLIWRTCSFPICNCPSMLIINWKNCDWSPWRQWFWLLSKWY